MQESSPSRSLIRALIWSFSRCRQERDSRVQSALVGVLVAGQRGQRLGDLLQRQPDVAGGADERQPAQHAALVPALAAGRAGRRQQPLRLVEPQRGRGEPAARRHLADRQQIGGLHDRPAPACLDFKLTSTSSMGTSPPPGKPGAARPAGARRSEHHERCHHHRRVPGPRPGHGPGADQPRLGGGHRRPPGGTAAPGRRGTAAGQVAAVPGDVTDPGHRAALVAAARALGPADPAHATTPARWARARCRRWPTTRRPSWPGSTRSTCWPRWR